MICEIQPVLSHTLGKTCNLTTDLGATAAFVRADRNQLKQVMLNLALNARDAMPSGGEFRIESHTVEISPDSPEGRAYRPAQYARLRFTDSGRGIDKATLARIFEPFFTTKHLGTGLGLAIVRRLTEAQGGSVHVEMGSAGGTTFIVRLPGARERASVASGEGPGRTPQGPVRGSLAGR